MWRLRVVIPSCYRHKILAEFHKNHPGMSRMKSFSRLYIWFPNIDKEIEKLVKTSETCEKLSNNLSKSPPHPWDWLNLWIVFVLISLNSEITNF